MHVCILLLPCGCKLNHDILDGSNIRRIVPDTQAVLRGITNSNPSLDTNVTNSDGVLVPEMAEEEVEVELLRSMMCFIFFCCFSDEYREIVLGKRSLTDLNP